jgi:DNA-binding response OmpR family regulator
MNSGARILIIEDEAPMRRILGDCLERQGYRPLFAADGEEGLAKALSEKPDLIVLDIMMPRLDGMAVCSELRRLEQRAPILMLTARGRIEDRVQGLDRGADDFLSKPFSREELLARIRALLRRVTRQTHAVNSVTLGSVWLDFVHQRATRHGQELHLTAKEFAMMRLLVESEGEPISRERFLDLVWGYSVFPTTRTVDKHVASLRGKIEENPEEPRFIRTVHAVGYRLELPDRTVEEVTNPSQSRPLPEA